MADPSKGLPPSGASKDKQQPRSNVSQWGPGQAQGAGQAAGGGGGGLQPRLSASGSMRRQSHRHSLRNSRRGSQMGPGGGEGQQVLQVIDDDGVDRTPKPLLTVKPSVLRGMGGQGGGHEDGTLSPSSEAGSEFFLDRLSSANFSRQGPGGWGSGSNSGAITPTRSEAVDEDYESQREKQKAAAAAAAAEEQQEEEELREHAERMSQAAATPEPVLQLLTERELDMPVDITLTETGTDFLFSMPCVTISTESDEAAAVEAANKRYSELLAAKVAADRYTDQEAQTLNPLTKAREAQSCVVTTHSSACQATPWDIADLSLGPGGDGAGQGGGEAAGGAHALPSVSQLAGAVAHGDGYGRGGGGGGGGGWAGSATGGSYMQTGSNRNLASMTGNGSMMRASTTVMSWANNSIATTVPGMMPSRASGQVPGGPPGVPGPPVDGPADSGPAAQEAAAQRALLALGGGLLPALRVMEMALCQNTYLPKLLQYRDITPIPLRPEPLPPAAHQEDATASRAMSTAPSRVISRAASRQVSESGSHPAPAAAPSYSEVASRAQSFGGQSQHLTQLDANALAAVNAAGASAGGPPANYAASMAESAWPEELLQDLADLGPDGVPRMEPLWEWTCPLTGGLQVVCMAWNKKVPDMLAVGYGTQAFSKAAAAAGMGSGCYGSQAASGKQGAAGGPGDTGALAASKSVANSVAAAAGAGGNDDQAEDTPVHGMVAFWSLKHPEFPLWHFKTRSGVTALDFSTHQPNILAVGLYDGTVAVYDVKSQQGSPAMEADSHTGRHSDPVWKVQWIDRGHERDEPLVSISTDGRVTQWSIAKGLEFSDLMALKRVPRKATAGTNGAAGAATGAQQGANASKGGAANGANAGKGGPASVGGEGDAFISRLTSGMSFDFSARDQRIYIAGTEDGWIHRCSTSYSEQYLESYEGHMGPIYALRWSPFRPNMWVSASADWTLRLWQEGRASALLNFQSGSHEVNDVQWCPSNSTVFGSVTSGGRLEIWDFGLSTVKPVVTHKAGAKLSCLLFSQHSPIVVSGSDSGTVSVFRLYNIQRDYDTVEEQLSRLEDVIRANVMKTQPGAAAV